MYASKVMGAVALALAMLLPGSAQAKQGGVCYTKTFHPQAKLNCEHIGRVTMSEIYAKGWRVVAVWTMDGSSFVTYVAIEEQ